MYSVHIYKESYLAWLYIIVEKIMTVLSVYLVDRGP